MLVDRSTAWMGTTLQTHPQSAIVFEIGLFKFSRTIWHFRALNTFINLNWRFQRLAQFLSVNCSLDVYTIRCTAAIIFLVVIGRRFSGICMRITLPSLSYHFQFVMIRLFDTLTSTAYKLTNLKNNDNRNIPFFAQWDFFYDFLSF